MAKVEVDSAFVEDVLVGNTGAWGLKTSEPHRRKNDAGDWETQGRTFRTVKVSRNSGISLDRFSKGDRVQFAGREITEANKSADGSKTFYDLVVWADTVELAGGSVQPVQADTWGADSETPF